MVAGNNAVIQAEGTTVCQHCSTCVAGVVVIGGVAAGELTCDIGLSIHMSSTIADIDGAAAHTEYTLPLGQLGNIKAV